MVLSLRLVLWIGTLFVAAIAWLMCAAKGFGLAPASYGTVATFVFAAALFCAKEPAAYGKRAGLVTSLEGLVLFSIISTSGAVLTYLAMAYSTGFTDDFLDRCDRLLGFDWLAIHDAVARHPWLRSLLETAYLACFPMPFVVIGTLHFAGLAERMHRFLAAYALGLLATVMVFYFFPARAAFAFYFGPDAALPQNAVHYGKAIAGLRDGSLEAIDLTNLGGIVTFPSFHAAMAILFAWAVWPDRRVRIPVGIVNALMWIAAVPVGGHYVVDLFAGSLIAVASIAMVSRNKGYTAPVLLPA